MGTEQNGDTRRGQRETRVVLALCAWQSALHAWQCIKSGDPRLLPPHAVAYLHDLLLLGVLLVAVRLVRRAIPRAFAFVDAFVSGAILIVAGALLAIYPQLLREYLAFPTSVLSSGDGNAAMLLKDYLGFRQLWPAAVAVIVACGALVAPVRLPLGRQSGRVLWVIVGALGLATLPRSPHPIVHSLRTEASALLTRTDRVVPPLQRPPSSSGRAPASAPEAAPMVGPLSASRVFLIVLEGVTAADFETEFVTNSRFLSRVGDRATYFSRYFATNLDSYTSLIAMLTSVQVPYRAYADESLYGAVNQSANLTRSLRALGFFTAFVSTYADQPFVPTRSDWDRVMDRGDLPSLEGWVSLGSSRMEAATEDRAALPTMVDMVTAHPRSFVLHELVYGHSTEWRATTGQSQLAYYDAYLLDLLDRLDAKGLGSQSLFVIVSDHGERTKAALAENYRVPLLVVGAPGAPRTDTAFRSHLDLQRIVASYLTRTALPSPRTQTHVVGSTERWVYGTIHANGEHLFIDDQTGVVLSSRGSADAPRLHESFQASLNQFGALYGK